MIPNTDAYAVLRDKSQQFLDFVVLSCSAVPVLQSHLSTSGVTGLTPDHFKGAPDKAQLTAYAAVYQETLSRMIVITLFSYFEAYVKGVMSEIIDFHGGEVKDALNNPVFDRDFTEPNHFQPRRIPPICF